MTWLADIGRSGLGSTVMQTAKDFSGLETARQNRQVGLEELRMNQEKSEREKRAFAYEEEKIQKQKKIDEYFVPFDMLFSTGVPGPDGNPIKLDATPTVQGQIIDWAKNMGASSEVGGKAGIKIGDSKAVMDMFALRLGWQKMASMGTLQDIDKQKQTIQMTLPTLKGNEAESAKQTMQGLIAREAQVIQGLQIIENKFKERLGDTAERLNQHFARTKGIDLGFTANTTWEEAEKTFKLYEIEKPQKTIIQSDKLQGAMAELGIDPNKPESYTTENIGKASSRLREQTGRDRRELVEIRQGEINEREGERRRTRIVEQFNNDPAVRKVEQIDQFSQLIIDVANSDNPVGHASLPTLMARSSGEVGNLSEADKKPFGGSKALDQRIKQVFTELYSGKRTPENARFISDLASAFQRTGLRKRERLARLRSKQYASALRGKMSEQDIYEMLAPLGGEEEQTGKRISVKMKSTGQTGSIPANEFDPKIYERL